MINQKSYFLCKTDEGLVSSTLLIFTCSMSIIETLEERCEICSKLTIKTPEQCQ